LVGAALVRGDVDSVRVLQVTPHYPPAYRFGGVLRVAHGLSKGLVNKGFEVGVITTTRGTEDSGWNERQPRHNRNGGVEVFFEPTVLSRKWGYSPGLAKRCKSEVPGSNLLVIHFHYQFASFVAARVARRCGVPFVVFSHACLRRDLIGRSLKKWLYLTMVERATFGNNEFIVFNAPEEAESSVFGNRGVVIPNGIDFSEFECVEQGRFRDRLGFGRNVRLYLTLGRLDVHQKGLDILIRALPEIRSVMGDFRVVICGPDEEANESKLRSIAKDCGVSDLVVFAGMQVGIQRLEALLDCDVFMMPSRGEGLSIALLEALFLGCPVVLSRNAGGWKMVESTGAGLVITPSVPDIRDSMVAMADEQYRDSFRGNARKVVHEKYSWTKIAGELVSQVSGLTRSRVK